MICNWVPVTMGVVKDVGFVATTKKVPGRQLQFAGWIKVAEAWTNRSITKSDRNIMQWLAENVKHFEKSKHGLVAVRSSRRDVCFSILRTSPSTSRATGPQLLLSPRG